MLEQFSFVLHATLDDLPAEAMQWQADPQANNIAVTVWHICRAQDVLKVKILEGQPDHRQLWYARGWASRTGYDPAGLGGAGFGNLYGYSQEQVKEVPLLSAQESLEYFDQVCGELKEYLAAVEPDVLEQPPVGWPDTPAESGPESTYEVLMAFLLDNREHLGEIKALKAMWKRKFVSASWKDI